MRQFHNIFIHKWQMADKVHIIIIIHDNRNTIKKSRYIQNRPVSYIGLLSIGKYFKRILNNGVFARDKHYKK